MENKNFEHKLKYSGIHPRVRQIEGEVSTRIKIILDTKLAIRDSTAPYKEP